MKKVEAAKWEAQRPADRTAARHAEEMSVLERERFSLAKAINDLESSLVQYESVLAIQKTTLGTLQAENAKHTRGEISKIEYGPCASAALSASWVASSGTFTGNSAWTGSWTTPSRSTAASSAA